MGEEEEKEKDHRKETWGDVKHFKQHSVCMYTVNQNKTGTQKTCTRRFFFTSHVTSRSHYITHACLASQYARVLHITHTYM